MYNFLATQKVNGIKCMSITRQVELRAPVSTAIANFGYFIKQCIDCDNLL